MTARRWTRIGCALGLVLIAAGCSRTYNMQFANEDVINEYKAEGNGHPLEVDIVVLDKRDAVEYADLRSVTCDQWFGANGSEGLRQSKYHDLRYRNRIYSFTDNEQIDPGRIGPALRGRSQDDTAIVPVAQIVHRQPRKHESEILIFARMYNSDGKVWNHVPVRIRDLDKQPSEIVVKVGKNNVVLANPAG